MTFRENGRQRFQTVFYFFLLLIFLILNLFLWVVHFVTLPVQPCMFCFPRPKVKVIERDYKGQKLQFNRKTGRFFLIFLHCLLRIRRYVLQGHIILQR